MQAWEVALCRAAAAQAGSSHLPGFAARGKSGGKRSKSTSNFNTKAAGWAHRARPAPFHAQGLTQVLGRVLSGALPVAMGSARALAEMDAVWQQPCTKQKVPLNSK